MRQNTS